jgi:hypothetical protein
MRIVSNEEMPVAANVLRLCRQCFCHGTRVHWNFTVRGGIAEDLLQAKTSKDDSHIFLLELFSSIKDHRLHEDLLEVSVRCQFNVFNTPGNLIGDLASFTRNEHLLSAGSGGVADLSEALAR